MIPMGSGRRAEVVLLIGGRAKGARQSRKQRSHHPTLSEAAPRRAMSRVACRLFACVAFALVNACATYRPPQIPPANRDACKEADTRVTVGGTISGVGAFVAIAAGVLSGVSKESNAATPAAIGGLGVAVIGTNIMIAGVSDQISRGCGNPPSAAKTVSDDNGTSTSGTSPSSASTPEPEPAPKATKKK